MKLTPRRLLHFLVGTALLLSFHAQMAAAGQACDNDELSLQKSKGQMAAQTHASDNFNGDCQDQAFEADLIASIPQPALRDPRLECFRQGYQEGVTRWLSNMGKRCERGCFSNGAAVGDYGARIFCDAGDKERPPNSMGCFKADTRKCQDAFLEYVIKNCPKKAAGEEWRRKYCSFARS